MKNIVTVNVHPHGVTAGALPTHTRDIIDDLSGDIISECITDALQKAKSEGFDPFSDSCIVVVQFKQKLELTEGEYD